MTLAFELKAPFAKKWDLGCAPPSLNFHIFLFCCRSVARTSEFIQKTYAYSSYCKDLSSPLAGLILLLTSVSEKLSPTTVQLPSSSSVSLLQQRRRLFIRHRFQVKNWEQLVGSCWLCRFVVTLCVFLITWIFRNSIVLCFNFKIYAIK